MHIGGLYIHAFPKRHDASEPHSFIEKGNGVTIGIFTDIGIACEHVVTNISQCHAAFLEANYDEKMLEEGNYPADPKNGSVATTGTSPTTRHSTCSLNIGLPL